MILIWQLQFSHYFSDLSFDRSRLQSTLKTKGNLEKISSYYRHKIVFYDRIYIKDETESMISLKERGSQNYRLRWRKRIGLMETTGRNPTLYLYQAENEFLKQRERERETKNKTHFSRLQSKSNNEKKKITRETL